MGQSRGWFLALLLFGCGQVANQPDAAGGGPSDAAPPDSGGTCVAANCPGQDTECQTRICNAQNQCDFDYVASGTAVSAQTPGDCQVQVCDGAGAITTVNDDTDNDDTLECTTDSCSNGTPRHVSIAASTACPVTSGGVCDGAGSCVTCVGGTNCFSDGSSGAFAPSANQTIPGGVYNFTTFSIPKGVVVTATGSVPLVIKTQGAVTINGSLVASGGNGTNGVTFTSGGVGGPAVAGGSAGGDGYFVASGGPFDGAPGLGPGAGGGGTSWGPGAGAGYAAGGGTVTFGNAVPGNAYGDPQLSTFTGGSGGGGGSGGNNCGGGGGGGGGGAIEINAFGGITIGAAGAILSTGGTGGTDGGGSCGAGAGGSGGAIWLRALSISHAGVINASGGAGGVGWQMYAGGNGSDGRIRIDVVNQTGSGTTTPASGHNGGAWYQ